MKANPASREPLIIASSILIAATALALLGPPRQAPWTPTLAGVLLSPPIAALLAGLAAGQAVGHRSLALTASGAILWATTIHVPAPSGSWQAALTVLTGTILVQAPWSPTGYAASILAGSALLLSTLQFDPLAGIAGLLLGLAAATGTPWRAPLAGAASLLATLTMYPGDPVHSAIILLAAPLLLAPATRLPQQPAHLPGLLAPPAALILGPAAGLLAVAASGALMAAEKRLAYGLVAAAAVLLAGAAAGDTAGGALAAAAALGVAGLAHAREYAMVITRRSPPSRRAALFLVLLGASLFAAAFYEPGSTCSVGVEPGDAAFGPYESVTAPLDPPRLPGAAFEDSLAAKLVLYREFPAVVAAPGIVGYVTVTDLAENESARVEPGGDAYLIVDLERPAMVQTAVDPDRVLQVSVRVEGLVVPWELLGPLPYNPPHTVLIVGFSHPMVLESTNGVEILVYEAVVAPAQLAGGRSEIEETGLGVTLRPAILGLSNATVRANGSILQVPVPADAVVTSIYRSLASLYSTSPDQALALSALPSLAKASGSVVTVEVPGYVYLEAGGGVCLQALEGSSTCTPLVVPSGLGACVSTLYQPVVQTPAGEVELLDAYLTAKATPRLGAYAVAGLVSDTPGAVVWAARYLPILVQEPAGEGRLYPLLGLGVLGGFLASAGLVTATYWGGVKKEEEWDVLGLAEAPVEGDVEVGES